MFVVLTLLLEGANCVEKTIKSSNEGPGEVSWTV